MAEAKHTYCIDSSSLLELRALDSDVFHGIWEVLADAVAAGILHAPHEVLREVTKYDTTTASWAKAHKAMFVIPNQALVDKVVEVQDKFSFFDPETDEPKADPFLVAHAILTGCTVVTQERAAGKSSKVKIPDACTHFGAKSITLSEFFREQGWTFVGSRKVTSSSPR